MRIRTSLLFLGLLAFVWPVWAEEIEGVEVTVEPLDQLNQSFHGYVEYRIRLRNLSPSDDRRVSLVYPRHSWSSGNCIQHLRKTVVLRADTEVVVSLFQPPLEMHGDDQLGVTVRGEEIGVHMSTQRHGLLSWHSSRVYPCMLYSRGMSSDIDQSIKDLYASPQNSSRSSSSRSYSPGTTQYELKRSEIDVEQWSDHWLGYSCFDAVFMSGREFQTAPNRVVDAISRYVECGGSLVIGGPWQVPKTWQDSKQTLDGMVCYYAGLGVCYHLSSTDPQQWPASAWKQMQRSWNSGAQGLTFMATPERANESFPVIENLAIPARGIFLLMLVFAVLIGPLNLLFFSKKGQRMRLFWTVPLVSLLTSGLVFGYSLLSEGVTGKVRLAGITWLDQRSHHAVTLGTLGYYCPLTPGGGLHFDQQTEVTPQVARNNYRSPSRLFTLNWSDRQELDSGWVTARVPSHLNIRRHETRRERLVVRQDTEGKLFATNGLGADIKELWVVNRDGRMYQAEQLIEGQTVPLKLQEQTYSTAPAGCLHQLYSRSWLQSIEGFTKTPQQVLRPGMYLAVMSEQPFLEPGQDSFRVMKNEGLVIGILD